MSTAVVYLRKTTSNKWLSYVRQGIDICRQSMMDLLNKPTEEEGSHLESTYEEDDEETRDFCK